MQRRAFEHRRKVPARGFVRGDEVMLSDTAQPDMVRGEAFAIVIDDGRDDGRASNIGRNALHMVDAILQDRDARRRCA